LRGLKPRTSGSHCFELSDTLLQEVGPAYGEYTSSFT
jgi:hypothetical protein